MVACRATSSIALTILVEHLILSGSVASFTPVFVPVLATYRPPLKFRPLSSLFTDMLPHGRLPLELRRQHLKLQFHIVHIKAANVTLARQDHKADIFAVEDNASKWQDPTAVLLFNGVSFLLLVISLCDLMQVCVQPIYFDVFLRF